MRDECRCHGEVVRLHRFFQDWFRGDLEEAEFGLCEAALAPGFTIVTPGGELIGREQILEAIRRHRGGEQPGFTIEAVGRSCQQVAGVHVSSYEERQTGTRSTVRLSTAVLSEENGRYLWHNVHETWITA